MPVRTQKLSDSSTVYSYTQVIKMLGISPSTLTNLVDKGAIEKVVPPGKKNGYYTRKSVDGYQNQQNLFLDTYIERKTNKLEIRKAHRSDQEAIFNFEKTIYPDPAPLELRLEWFDKNPNIDFVAFLDGEVIGHLSLLPIPEATILTYLASKEVHWFTGKTIEAYEPNKQYTLYIMSAAVKQLEDQNWSKYYAGHLLEEGIKCISAIAEEGKIIRRIYARSRTQSGIFIANRLQFDALAELSTTRRHTFVLDMATSPSKWARQYRELLRSLDLPKETTNGILK